MNKFTVINIISIVAVVSACGKMEPNLEKMPLTAPAVMELKVISRP